MDNKHLSKDIDQLKYDFERVFDKMIDYIEDLEYEKEELRDEKDSLEVQIDILKERLSEFE